MKRFRPRCLTLCHPFFGVQPRGRGLGLRVPRELRVEPRPCAPRRIGQSWFLLVALSLACDSTEPTASAPDLTGSYGLLSLTSPELAGGATLTSPVVGGTLEFGQYTGNGERAIGDASFYWWVDTDLVSASTGAAGPYRQETNGGPISMLLNGMEYAGSYTLDGDTLALNLVQGPFLRHPITHRIPKGRTLWLRDDSP